MACPISPEDINKLKMFIQFASVQPAILNLPDLKFFKDFVVQLGGKVPEGNFSTSSAGAGASPHFEKAKSETKPTAQAAEEEPAKVESDPESDVELELLDTLIEGDKDADTMEMGDDNKEPTEEDIEQASDLRSKAAQAYSNGDFEDAVTFYTESILLNPKNSLFYAKRGQVFLKLKKPNAAIRDCRRALELNPDSASAYKFRGRAHRLLGNWEEAAKDLRQACKLDYDDEADEWLKEVTPNAKKLEQHKVKQERKKAEKELNERRERVRKAQEANRRAEEERARQEEAGGDGGFPGGIPADFMDAFNDPEVAAALQDVMTNPGNIVKYQNNPKVMNLLKKFAGGMGGMGGGMPGMGGMGGMPGMGGMGGFPGFGGMGGGFGGPPPSGGAPPSSGGQPDSKPKSDSYDDGLD